MFLRIKSSRLARCVLIDVGEERFVVFGFIAVRGIDGLNTRLYLQDGILPHHIFDT